MGVVLFFNQNFNVTATVQGRIPASKNFSTAKQSAASVNCGNCQDLGPENNQCRTVTDDCDNICSQDQALNTCAPANTIPCNQDYYDNCGAGYPGSHYCGKGTMNCPTCTGSGEYPDLAACNTGKASDEICRQSGSCWIREQINTCRPSREDCESDIPSGVTGARCDERPPGSGCFVPECNEAAGHFEDESECRSRTNGSCERVRVLPHLQCWKRRADGCPQGAFTSQRACNDATQGYDCVELVNNLVSQDVAEPGRRSFFVQISGMPEKPGCWAPGPCGDWGSYHISNSHRGYPANSTWRHGGPAGECEHSGYAFRGTDCGKCKRRIDTRVYNNVPGYGTVTLRVACYHSVRCVGPDDLCGTADDDDHLD